MQTVLICDVETTGLDPDVDEIVEVGCVLFSLTHRTVLETYSAVLPTNVPNAARGVNGIPEDTPAQEVETAWAAVGLLAERADAIVAYKAEFDRSFVAAEASRQLEAFGTAPWVEALDKTWICLMDDFVWPVQTDRRDLVSVALAHGVGVTAAHRAYNDCLLIARCFEVLALGVLNERLENACWRAEQPKEEVVSLLSYDDRHIVKADRRFHFKKLTNTWHAHLLESEIEALPFRVVRVSETSYGKTA